MLHCCFHKPPNTKYFFISLYFYFSIDFDGNFLFCFLLFYVFLFCIPIAWFLHDKHKCYFISQNDDRHEIIIRKMYKNKSQPACSYSLSFVFCFFFSFIKSVLVLDSFPGQWKPFPNWLHFCLDLSGAIPIPIAADSISLFLRPMLAKKKNALLFCNLYYFLFFTKIMKKV